MAGRSVLFWVYLVVCVCIASFQVAIADNNYGPGSSDYPGGDCQPKPDREEESGLGTRADPRIVRTYHRGSLVKKISWAEHKTQELPFDIDVSTEQEKTTLKHYRYDFVDCRYVLESITTHRFVLEKRTINGHFKLKFRRHTTQHQIVNPETHSLTTASHVSQYHCHENEFNSDRVKRIDNIREDLVRQTKDGYSNTYSYYDSGNLQTLQRILYRGQSETFQRWDFPDRAGACTNPEFCPG